MARRAAFIVAFALATPRAGAGADPTAAPRNVLILFQDPPNVPAIVAMNDGLRRVLQGQAGLNLYTEHLDLSRFPGEEFEGGLRRWLQVKYAQTRLDLVVAAGAGAVAFATQPARTWPDVPIVFCGVDERLTAPFRSLPGVTGIITHYPIRETMELAIRLFPSAMNLVLVGGASGQDLAWRELLRSEAATLPKRVVVAEVFGLSMADTLETLRKIPRGSPVIGMTFLRDGAGRPWTGPEAIRALEPVAPGPVFSTYDFLVGRGAAGGVVVDFDRLGQETGELALQVLGGKPASSLPLQVSSASRVLLDWRVLERWGVAEDLVPPGAVVRFRALPAWREHPRIAAGVLLALIVQGALIAILLLERRRRRLAEVAANDSRAVVAHMNRVGSVSELAGSLAHEINTPLASIQNGARAIRRMLAARDGGAGEDLMANLEIIESEGRRAGEVIRRMRSVLRRDPSQADTVDAREIASEAVALVRPQARQRGVELNEHAPQDPLAVEGDRVQLLQVILNLLLNAIEAVAPLEGHRRRVDLRVEAVGGTVRIRVYDAGPGFSAAARARLFEPFFTTKESGLGMGLSISRTIVEAHGGRMWIGDGPGGAAVNVDLPALRPAGLGAAREAT
jgi:signal transduction histidine kinase